MALETVDILFSFVYTRTHGSGLSPHVCAKPMCVYVERDLILSFAHVLALVFIISTIQ